MTRQKPHISHIHSRFLRFSFYLFKTKGPFGNYISNLSKTYNPYPNTSIEVTYQDPQLSPVIVKGNLCTETVVINSYGIKNQTILKASEINNTGSF